MEISSDEVRYVKPQWPFGQNDLLDEPAAKSGNDYTDTMQKLWRRR